MKSLIVQSDMSMMLNTDCPNFKEIVESVIKFSEIQQSLDTLFIFKVTEISIWNAIELSITKNELIATLEKYSMYSLSTPFKTKIDSWFSTYGVATLEKFESNKIILKISNDLVRKSISKIRNIKNSLLEETTDGIIFSDVLRGEVKSQLAQNGFSVKDLIGSIPGKTLNFSLNAILSLRDYQEESSQAVYDASNGVVVLPCGSGKTVVGINLMYLCQTETLIITNSTASVAQWKESLLKFTSLTEEEISCYNSDNKRISKVTITTYSMIAYRKGSSFPHFDKFKGLGWGLLILDETHLMPADLFRIVSSFQACVRLALTATFVREDNREKEIFTLIGPKRYEKPFALPEMIHGCRLAGEMEKEDNLAWVSRESRFRRIRFFSRFSRQPCFWD